MEVKIFLVLSFLNLINFILKLKKFVYYKTNQIIIIYLIIKLTHIQKFLSKLHIEKNKN
jgi:hypothetical protein